MRLVPQAGTEGERRQAGFTPKSPGIAEQSPRSGCPWAECGEPSPLGTLPATAAAITRDA